MEFESFGKCSCCEIGLHGGNHNGCEDCNESMCDECTKKNNDGDPICTVCHYHLKNTKTEKVLQNS